MTEAVEHSESNARILLYSQRSPFSNFHYRAGLYEFEDIIRQVDSVDMIAPHYTRWFEHRTRIANRLASTFHTSVNPGIRRMRVRKDYDVFIAVAQFPKDLLHMQYLDGWKDRCKTTICWLNEIYIQDIATSRHFLRLLSRFDHVILQQFGSIEPVQQVANKTCTYSPSGVDAMLFCPHPDPPPRAIDVYSIGRRSKETHETLLKMARHGKTFYVYDTLSGEQVAKPEEHRFLYANMAKRSRYFIVNRGNVDKLGRVGQVEFGNRFFEGAAAGTIMIGDAPRNEVFPKVFNWPDAVVDVPFGSDSVDTVIRDLDRQPERQARIRTDNVVHSLLEHDWVYRWAFALELAGLEPMPQLAGRTRRLKSLAALVSAEAAGGHRVFGSDGVRRWQ